MKYIKSFDYMLIQKNSFIGNSNCYYNVDNLSNSLFFSPVYVTINTRFYNFFSVNLSVML